MSLGGPLGPQGPFGSLALSPWAPHAKPGSVINCVVDCFCGKVSFPKLFCRKLGGLPEGPEQPLLSLGGPLGP